MLAFNTPGGTSGKLAVIFFFGGVIGMLLSKYLCRRKEFEITKPTFYRVEGLLSMKRFCIQIFRFGSSPDL